MSPKEKAEELVDKHYGRVAVLSDACCKAISRAKENALITVDEILQADWFIENKQNYDSWVVYWQEVKQEIEKL